MEHKSKVINFRWEKLKHHVKKLLYDIKQIIMSIFKKSKKSPAYSKNKIKGYRKVQGKRKI